MESTRIQTTIRLSPSLLDTLREQAAAANRTLSNYLEVLLSHGATKPLSSEQVDSIELESQLDEAFKELRAFKEGKIKCRKAEELLNEL